MNQTQLLDTVHAFLRQWRTAALATVDAQGRPHAANVFFVSDEKLRLAFLTDPTTAHGQHIADRPDVAVSIYAHVDERPDQIHGLQLHGRCQPLPQPAAEATLVCYCEKFGFAPEAPSLRARLKSHRVYRITPTWARWLDNRERFGFKQELDLAIA